MKKFLVLMFALTILTATVEAADDWLCQKKFCLGGITMKKFLVLMFALTILTTTVEAADVPDIRQISQNIALVQTVPADENSAGVYEYICEDDNATRYFNQYAQLLIDSGFEIIDGRQQGDDVMIWGLIHPDKDVPVFQFELDTPVHVLIKQTGLELKIQTAPGITYGEE